MTARRTLASLLFLLLATTAGILSVPHSRSRSTENSGYTCIYAARQPQRQRDLLKRTLSAAGSPPAFEWPSPSYPPSAPALKARPRAPPVPFP